MISLERNFDPSAFPSSFSGTTRREWELDLLTDFRKFRKGEIEKVKFSSSRWKQAKENLLYESKNKCAYCEAYFSTVAYGDVEHYRPKSKYWWLAYSYHNYSASCQLCNQKYKKARFPSINRAIKAPLIRKNSTDTYIEKLAGTSTVDPLDDELGLKFSDFLAEHSRERPMSIDPYLDDPENYFKFSFNDLTREVFIEPLNNEIEIIANSAIKLFGLNRKELRDLRYRGFLKYRFIRKVAENSNDSIMKEAAKKLISSEFLASKTEFCGMYRYFEKESLNNLIPAST